MDRVRLAGDELQNVLDGILVRIIKEYRPQQVILFGSYAAGTAGPNSDIDLLIVTNSSGELLDRRVSIHHIVTGSPAQVSLDVLVLTPREIQQRLAFGDRFLRETLEHGKVIYNA